MKEKYDEHALLFKALSDSNRLLIIESILEGEICACKVLEKLQISQSTLSYHMKILCDTGIVFSRKEGKWMHYSLSKVKFEELKELLEVFLKDRPIGDLKCT
jgi:ArsR family transcriptional regulator, arsenate/arsenite/antimonite-responsive transcriptional repressor